MNGSPEPRRLRRGWARGRAAGLFGLVGVVLCAAHARPASGQEGDEDPVRQARLTEHLKHGQPEVACEDCSLVVREGYVLLHDPRRKIPLWVAYRLDGRSVRGSVQRAHGFIADPELGPAGATPADYQGSYYALTPLATPASMRRSFQAFSEAHYLSNAAPQRLSFYQRSWSTLEAQIRDWVEIHKQLWVYVGPAFEPDKEPERIGSGVAVPDQFWAVIIREDEEGKPSALGCLIPHQPDAGDFSGWRTTVDKVQAATGIDFLTALPAEEQARVEGAIDVRHWRLTPRPTPPPPSAHLTPRPTAPRPGAAPAPARPTPASQTWASKRLSRGDTMIIGDLRLRLVRVSPGADIPYIELNVISAARGSQTIVLREHDTTFFEGYEITVERVRPNLSPSRTGEGDAYLYIRAPR